MQLVLTAKKIRDNICAQIEGIPTQIPAKKVDIELNLNRMNEHQKQNIYQLEFEQTKAIVMSWFSCA